MSQLDKSWLVEIAESSEVPVEYDIKMYQYLEKFQKKAIEALKNEINKPGIYNGRSMQDNCYKQAIEIIKNLKAY